MPYAPLWWFATHLPCMQATSCVVPWPASHAFIPHCPSPMLSPLPASLLPTQRPALPTTSPTSQARKKLTSGSRRRGMKFAATKWVMTVYQPLSRPHMERYHKRMRGGTKHTSCMLCVSPADTPQLPTFLHLPFPPKHRSTVHMPFGEADLPRIHTGLHVWALWRRR